MDGMNVQVSAASAAVHTAVLRRLCVPGVESMRISVAAQMMPTILEVVIDAGAHRCAAFWQGQMRCIRGEETHAGKRARSLTSLTSGLNDHTMKRVMLRLQCC